MADSEDLLQAEQQLALSQCPPFGFGVHCTLAILTVVLSYCRKPSVERCPLLSIINFSGTLEANIFVTT